MEVVILHDDVPAEAGPDQQDTMIQVREVEQALRLLGHHTRRLTMAGGFESLRENLRQITPGLVFNLVESVEGRGELIHLAPKLLEDLGLPFTGVGSEGQRLTTDKLTAKRLMHSHGLPTPDWIEESGGVDPAGREFIIKSRWEHGSLGLESDSVVNTPSRDRLLADLSRRRQTQGGEWFAEAYIEGREFNVSVLTGAERRRILPIAEIVFEKFTPARKRMVGYRAKWDSESFEYHHTVRRFVSDPGDEELTNKLAGLAGSCWDLFDMNGCARVDFRVDENGQPWILEVNANPCLSSDAGFMAAAGEAGLSQIDVVEILVKDAMTRAGASLTARL